MFQEQAPIDIEDITTTETDSGDTVNVYGTPVNFRTSNQIFTIKNICDKIKPDTTKGETKEDEAAAVKDAKKLNIIYGKKRTFGN